MSDILTDYRKWRSQQEDRIGTHSDDCHLWPRHERCMIHRLAAELATAQLVADRLRDELASATRHMEMAEAAWLRATMGTLPTHATPGECSVADKP
jgi:hypothetical protein